MWRRHLAPDVVMKHSYVGSVKQLPVITYGPVNKAMRAAEEWADEVVWRNLLEGVPTVLVGEESELLLAPLRRGALDRILGRVPTNVSHRIDGRATPYATSSRLGRHPVRQMRKLAHAA